MRLRAGRAVPVYPGLVACAAVCHLVIEMEIAHRIIPEGSGFHAFIAAALTVAIGKVIVPFVPLLPLFPVTAARDERARPSSPASEENLRQDE